jgi:plasmid stabilization system protein ParE
MPALFQLTEEATRDLERAMDYLSQHSIPAALHVADLLEEAFNLLARFPNSGYRRTDFAHSPVRFWNAAGYLITYLPATTPLLILSVVHASRDADPEIEFRLHKK